MARTTDTREDLLDAGLAGFTERGFEATSIRDLAAAVGIKESSVYNHFESKQALWDAVLDRASSAFDNAAQELDVNVLDPVGAAADYQALDATYLADPTEKLFDFYLHDPATRALRRLVSLEQFRDPRAADLLSRRFVLAPLSYLETLFIRMFGVSTEEAEHLALAFWGPVHLLQTLAARDEPRARVALRKHALAFVAHISGGSAAEA